MDIANDCTHELSREIIDLISRNYTIDIRKKTFEDRVCERCNKYISCGTSICPLVQLKEVPKCCDPAQCDDCVYIGGGAFICFAYDEIVVADWNPTKNYLMCKSDENRN